MADWFEIFNAPLETVTVQLGPNHGRIIQNDKSSFKDDAKMEVDNTTNYANKYEEKLADELMEVH